MSVRTTTYAFVLCNTFSKSISWASIIGSLLLHGTSVPYICQSYIKIVQ